MCSRHNRAWLPSGLTRARAAGTTARAAGTTARTARGTARAARRTAQAATLATATVTLATGVATLATGAVTLAACGEGAAAVRPGAHLQIVAAESFWGSITTQLAGPAASVHSIIASPAVDPHTYEPTSADARAMAGAQLTIVNGLGYDPWAPRLLAADDTPARARLDVGALLGLRQGENPHRWYDPAGVEAVVRALTARLATLAPQHAALFAARRQWFERTVLGRYHALIATIRRRYGGTAVGASESIVSPMAAALGLRLLTPARLTRAVAEGGEVTAGDLAAAERQLQSRQVRVWIFNPQNDVAEVRRLTALAHARGIPIVRFTETPDPAHASFQAWQDRQLAALERALVHRPPA